MVKIEDGEPLIIGLTITVGALPAVIFLIYAEKIVDYCGHSNILIYCFVNYIIHHLGSKIANFDKNKLFMELFQLSYKSKMQNCCSYVNFWKYSHYM